MDTMLYRRIHVKTPGQVNRRATTTTGAKCGRALLRYDLIDRVSQSEGMPHHLRITAEAARPVVVGEHRVGCAPGVRSSASCRRRRRAAGRNPKVANIVPETCCRVTRSMSWSEPKHRVGAAVVKGGCAIQSRR